jgi:hypothetical protein
MERLTQNLRGWQERGARFSLGGGTMMPLTDELSGFLVDYGVADSVGSPSAEMLAWLAKQGVPETALSGWAGLGPDNCGACPSPLLASRVVWQGKRFDFGPHGAVACLIIECRAEEPYDLVAFNRTRIASLLGRTAMLREDVLTDGPEDVPVPVHSGGLAWLRANRLGLVVIDPALAAYRLAGRLILAEDTQRGLQLRRTLVLAPRIVVPYPANTGPA